MDDAWTAGKEPDGLAGRFGAKPEVTKPPRAADAAPPGHGRGDRADRRQRDLDRLDLALALKLEPALVGAGLGQAHEERDPAVPADAALALVRVGVREGLAVLVDEQQVPERSEPRLEVVDRPPLLVGQRRPSR